MASISTSQALAKRSSDTALMPPPPRPKRIKRPQKVLDEDEYTDAISHIIARDFFPGLIETESQQDYLNALEAQDHEWIAAAGRKLTEVMTPGPDGRRLRGRRGTSMTPVMGLYGRSGETPKAWQGDTPMSVASMTSNFTIKPEKPEVDTSLSLSAFQTKYTSEDNESFYKLLDKQNLKKAEKYAWMWAGNKIPAPRQIAHRKREALLAANKSQNTSSSKQLIKASDTEDTRKAMPDSWPTDKPANNFMFDPGSVEDSTQTTHQAAEETSRAPPKAVVYDNTRLRAEPTPSSDPPPSPSLSAVGDALAGRPRPTASEAGAPGSATPRINGYAFVDSAPSPTPSELGAPSLTWGSIEGSASLLGSGDKTPNPFNIKEGSKREALHHRMVEKVAKGKRSVKKEAELRTPVPRFASSPRLGKEGLTPAAQRLLGRVGGTPVRLGVAGGRGGESVKRLSGLREAYTPKM